MTQRTARPIQVVVADADVEDMARTRSLLLQDRNLQVAATITAREYLLDALSVEPDILLLSTNIELHDTAGLVKQVLDISPHTQVLLISTPNDAVDLSRTMLAGARGVLQKPLGADGFLNTLHELVENELARRQRLEERARQRQIKATQGRIITLFSPKGGVGCTLLACNLALALRRATQKRVALVDYSLQFGTIGSLLNLQSIHTLAELAPLADSLDSTMLDDVLVRHGSGIQVLLPPTTMAQVEEVTADSLIGILEALRNQFDYVVVDTWHALEDVTLALMGITDDLLLVSTPEVPALHTMRRFLEMLKDYPDLRKKPRLLVNRHPSQGGVDLAVIEQSLGMQALATVPSDGQAMMMAINEGIPVLHKNLDNAAVRNLHKLAEVLALPGDLVADTTAAGTQARRFSLGWRRSGS